MFELPKTLFRHKFPIDIYRKIHIYIHEQASEGIGLTGREFIASHNIAQVTSTGN